MTNSRWLFLAPALRNNSFLDLLAMLLEIYNGDDIKTNILEQHFQYDGKCLSMALPPHQTIANTL